MLELLRSSLGDQSQSRELKQAASGPLPITSLLKQHRSCSPIDTTNSGSMETTSKSCSQQSQCQYTQNYSVTTPQSDTKLGRDRTCSLPTENSLHDTMRPLSRPTELELMECVTKAKELRERAESQKLTSAIVSMEKTDASLQQDNANTSTSAKSASRVDMERWNAKLMRQCEELGKRPCYLRHNVYCDDDLSSCSCAKLDGNCTTPCHDP